MPLLSEEGRSSVNDREESTVLCREGAVRHLVVREVQPDNALSTGSLKTLNAFKSGPLRPFLSGTPIEP